MPNKLAQEKSPYLLQHADNPVHWQPWGPEALADAQRQDKPILVSIGYSACHWCHVMAHESFENEDVARLMNDLFINVKVDREERPDVDAIYMEAVQALSGHGGWPLNVFLTPDGRPFYGGTYFPPEPRHGMPSWSQVLQAVANSYREDRSGVMQNASVLTDYIRRSQQLAPSAEPLTPEILNAAYRSITNQFDPENGGFGGAPKFPQPLSLEFVLRMWKRSGGEAARQFVEFTLRSMADGGIVDQLGGGFHRYSVDAAWVVPHFEKMLYDNALLARVYLHAYQITHDDVYRRVVESTLDYLLRDLRSPEGGFYSAEDADSEGVEGKYYVWTPPEIESALGPEAARVFDLRYGVTSIGNFEGTTILAVARTIPQVAREAGMDDETVEHVLAEARQTLLDVRSHRVPPGKDTKILVSWNALAIRALAEAGQVLRRPDYLRAAERAAAFILDQMRPEGELVRSYKDGPSRIPAFLEDYSYLVEALVTLYETAFDPVYLEKAQSLTEQMVQRFWDDGQGAFFDSQAGLEEPVARPRSFFDNPIPSGNSAAAFGLLRLEALTGESVYSSWALPAIRSVRDLLARAPTGFSYMLCALDFYLSPQTQVAIVGRPGAPDTQELVDTVSGRYEPNVVMAVGPEGSSPLLAGRTETDGKATAYVCEHFTCRLPVTDATALEAQLADRTTPSP